MAKKLKPNFINFILSNISRIYSWNSFVLNQYKKTSAYIIGTLVMKYNK